MKTHNKTKAMIGLSYSYKC